MEYSKSLSFDCPYCYTKCQFEEIEGSSSFCKIRHTHHIGYKCTNCGGLIITQWVSRGENDGRFEALYAIFIEYFPAPGEYSSRVNLSLILDENIKEDFVEAIQCYNKRFYNASMIMARKVIQQEMINKGAKGDNLYEEIESIGISPKLKKLLHKIKNFGNNGAHPDFCLFDEKGNKIEDKKEFAKLSLEFLDRYFADEYEIDSLINNAPRSKKELES